MKSLLKWGALLAAPWFLVHCNPTEPTSSQDRPALSAQLEIVPTPGAAWVARHGLTAAGYQSEFNTWVGQGYRLTWVSGYAVGTEARYAAIFEKTAGPAWIAKHGMTASQYQTEFNAQAANGYRLALVNGYAVNNVAYFAAIWQKTSGGALIARHNLTAAQYQSEFNTQVANGYRLLHVSGYVVGGVPYFAAIWAKQSGPAWIARHNLTAAQYQSEFNTQAANGYQLMDVSGYGIGGTDYYAAIWEKRSDYPWLARHAMTSSQYQAAVTDYKHQGYRPILVSGYTVNGQDRYAAIFKNYVYSGSALNALDAPAKALLANTGAPSVSIAVTHGGKLVYAKGYGWAIKASATDAAVPATSISRYRIMSISKSITAVSLERMQEMGLLSLKDSVFGPGHILGTDYGSSFYPNVTKITVANLMNHAAGGWGRNTMGTNNSAAGVYCNEPTLNTPPGVSIGDIIKSVIKNCPLDKDGGVTRVPGTVFDYSNFGYSVLGRVIEKRGGTSYENWVRTHVLAPMGITGMVMAPSTKAARLQDEVVYYANGNPNWPYGFDVPRMDSHGGWLATPIDLARYATYVDNQSPPTDIFTNRPGSWTDMTTPAGLAASPRYAKGWVNQGSSPNVIWHDGSLDGTSSILMQTSDGFTLCAISNTRDNLGTTDLWNLMTAVKNSGVAWSSADLY